MNTYDLQEQQKVLSDAALLAHGYLREQISKEQFFHSVWATISNFVHYHKHNPLIQDAVSKNRTLTPHAYTVLTILYGAYAQEPTKLDILMDFIRLLDKDLIEEELRIVEYARAKSGNVYYGGLASLLSKIREICGDPDFLSSQMPPVPYHSYVLLTLHHARLIRPDVSLPEIYFVIAQEHARMMNIFALAKPTRK